MDYSLYMTFARWLILVVYRSIYLRQTTDDTHTHTHTHTETRLTGRFSTVERSTNRTMLIDIEWFNVLFDSIGVCQVSVDYEWRADHLDVAFDFNRSSLTLSSSSSMYLYSFKVQCSITNVIFVDMNSINIMNNENHFLDRSLFCCCSS
jgi:hypothetical protein